MVTQWKDEMDSHKFFDSDMCIVSCMYAQEHIWKCHKAGKLYTILDRWYFVILRSEGRMNTGGPTSPLFRISSPQGGSYVSLVCPCSVCMFITCLQRYGSISSPGAETWVPGQPGLNSKVLFEKHTKAEKIAHLASAFWASIMLNVQFSEPHKGILVALA